MEIIHANDKISQIISWMYKKGKNMENRKFDRRRFLKTGILGLAGTAAGNALLKASPKSARLPLVEKEKLL